MLMRSALAQLKQQKLLKESSNLLQGIIKLVTQYDQTDHTQADVKLHLLLRIYAECSRLTKQLRLEGRPGLIKIFWSSWRAEIEQTITQLEASKIILQSPLYFLQQFLQESENSGAIQKNEESGAIHELMRMIDKDYKNLAALQGPQEQFSLAIKMAVFAEGLLSQPSTAHLNEEIGHKLIGMKEFLVEKIQQLQKAEEAHRQQLSADEDNQHGFTPIEFQKLKEELSKAKEHLSTNKKTQQVLNHTLSALNAIRGLGRASLPLTLKELLLVEDILGSFNRWKKQQLGKAQEEKSLPASLKMRFHSWKVDNLLADIMAKANGKIKFSIAKARAEEIIRLSATVPGKQAEMKAVHDRQRDISRILDSEVFGMLAEKDSVESIAVANANQDNDRGNFLQRGEEISRVPEKGLGVEVAAANLNPAALESDKESNLKEQGQPLENNGGPTVVIDANAVQDKGVPRIFEESSSFIEVVVSSVNPAALEGNKESNLKKQGQALENNSVPIVVVSANINQNADGDGLSQAADDEGNSLLVSRSHFRTSSKASSSQFFHSQGTGKSNQVRGQGMVEDQGGDDMEPNDNMVDHRTVITKSSSSTNSGPEGGESMPRYRQETASFAVKKVSKPEPAPAFGKKLHPKPWRP